MSEQPTEPDLTPQPSPILAEPATPATCQQDYAQAADIRERLGWKDDA
ncbi:hypothetical protein ACFY9A_28935 [Streptomyces rubradiris]